MRYIIIVIMPITYFLLLFFFLSLSLHASECTRLRALESMHRKKLASSAASIKNDESLNSGSKGSINSLEDRSKMEKINCTTSGKFACEEHDDDKTEELQERKAKNNNVINNKHGRTSQGVKVSQSSVHNHSHIQNGPVKSISWHVPRNNKPSRKHLGFSSDYSPPKTHPPSHNR